MRAAQSRTQETERKDMIVAVVTQTAALFDQLPMLCIADVSVHGWLDLQATLAVCDEIAQTMLELLEEHPEARQLVRGFTVARTFH